MRRHKNAPRIERLEPRYVMAGDISLVRSFATWDGGVVPSSDVSDVTYHPPTGDLFLTDSEIDELGVFRGYNIFQVNLRGSELQYEIKSGNREPTGITYNQFDGYFYVTNDDGQRTITRYDDRLDTPLAVVSTLDADPTANDPEGITSDPATGNLYVINGETLGRIQILTYDRNLRFLSRFFIDNVAVEAEGIAFHPASRHLFVVDGAQMKILEFTLSGGLVQTYDIGGFSPRPINPGGLAFAPTSNTGDSPSALALYMTDRGQDNVPDGRVYEAVLGGSTTPPDDPPVDDPPTETIAIDRRIKSGNDDVEQRSAGSVNFGSRDLELVVDRFDKQTVGLRFTNLKIPQGAVVKKARIVFTVDEVDTGSASLKIVGHDMGDAPAFGSGNRDVSGRAATSASIAWSPKTWTSVGATEKSPRITSIIQEIVNRSDWSAGNALALVISGTGRRTAVAFEGNASAAPLLKVEFEAASSSSPRSAAQRAGLRLSAGDLIPSKSSTADAGVADLAPAAPSGQIAHARAVLVERMSTLLGHSSPECLSQHVAGRGGEASHADVDVLFEELGNALALET